MKLRILTIAFLAIAPLGLYAQEGLRDRDRTLEASKLIASDLQKARLHYGPFYFLSRVELADIGYSQTLFVPTSDSSTGIALGISAPQRLYFVPTKKQVYSVQVTPQYAFATSALSDSQGGYLGRVDAQYLLNHLYLDFYGLRADELRVPTAELNRLATVRESTGGLSGEFKYSSRTSASFSAVSRKLEHPETRLQPENIPITLLDRTEQNYRLSLMHKTFPVTSLFVAGEASNYEFDRALFRKATRQYAGGGAVRDSGRLTQRIEVGVAKLEFERASGGKDFHGLVGNFLTSYDLTGRTSLSGSASRDLEFSVFSDNNYYVLDHGSASINYLATRHLTLTATTSVVRDNYPLATLAPTGQFLNRRDRATFTSVGWLYTVRRVRGGFDVGYYRRSSNFDIDEQNGIRLVLRLSITP